MAVPMSMLSSGQLDRVIVLQRKLTPARRDALGNEIETWVDLCPPLYAGKIEGGGGEDTRAAEAAAQISMQFVIRDTGFAPPLNPRDRLLFNAAGGPPEQGLVLNIRRVEEIGRRVGHLIDAWARADQQS